MSFLLPLAPDTPDFELCLFCGQVFRFVRAHSGFVGWDGIHQYAISRIDAGWEVEADREAFERLFRFDVPLAALHRDLIHSGAEMEAIIAGTPGLRTMRPSDASETLFCFLCTSNNNISRITQMIGKLASFGEDGLFPAAEVIASVGEAKLRELGFGYRAVSISGAAQRLSEPGILEQLKIAPYADAFKELLTFHGVGPKLADCICLYALDHTEAVPVDTHMWQAFTRTYRPDLADLHPSEKRMRDVGEFMRDRFGRLAGFAQHYLFVENLRRPRGSRA